MSFTFPVPPHGSSFRMGYDEQGRVRLTWRRPSHWLGELLVWAWLIALTAILGALVHRMWGPVAAAGFAVLVTAWKLRVCVHGGRADRLTLGEGGLRYVYDDMTEPGWGWQVREVPRAAVYNLRVDRVFEAPGNRGRQRLMLDWGPAGVEVGRGLREPDRAWLAGVLRAWAEEGKRSAPAGPLGPPFRCSITAEYEGDGALRLHWMPRGRVSAIDRWDEIVKLAGYVLFSALAGGTVLFLIVAVPIFCLAGGGALAGWERLMLLLALTCVYGGAVPGRQAIRELRPLLRGPTEERLTLAPLALHYQPGRYFDYEPGRSLKVRFRPPREVPLSEIGAIQREWAATHQRLMIGHGAETFEVGPTLREAERQWLAGILRTWAGIPAEEDRAGRDGDGGELIKADRAVEQDPEPATGTPRRQ